MGRGKYSVKKRARDTVSLQRKEDKAKRRAERKEGQPEDGQEGEDPDLAGIVAGPQPPRQDD